MSTRSDGRTAESPEPAALKMTNCGASPQQLQPGDTLELTVTVNNDTAEIICIEVFWVNSDGRGFALDIKRDPGEISTTRAVVDYQQVRNMWGTGTTQVLAGFGDFCSGTVVEVDQNALLTCNAVDVQADTGGGDGGQDIIFGLNQRELMLLGGGAAAAAGGIYLAGVVDEQGGL